MNTTLKILTGFLVGAALGTATGLLMAPTTGTRARKNINKKAKKLLKQIESLVAKEKKRASRSTVAKQVRNGKAAVALH